MADQSIDTVRNPIKLFLLIVIAIFLVLRCLYLYISDAQRFPVSVVKVKSSFNYVERMTIESTISPFLDNSFFTLPVRKLHQQLQGLDGIEHVDVVRQWPNKLILNFEEKEPIAIWGDQFLSRYGDTFRTPNPILLDTLPRLYGPEKNKKDILHTYQKLSKILSRHGLYCKQLNYDPAQGWQLTLKNDMLIELGNQHIISRLKRFLRRLPAIQAESSARVNYADLRYRHGVAVKYEK